MPDIDLGEIAARPIEGREWAGAAESPKAGAALCLSGGGYRAMLFHAGALIRLNEAGVLGRLSQVSSVSGGSIIAALLGLRWKALSFEGGESARLQPLVIEPVRKLARENIDVPSIVEGAVLGSISKQVCHRYDELLFEGATLADLPDGDGPRFVINATNVQTGSLFRFSRPYMGDYQVGRWNNPSLSLAIAVTASSAFPPVLSPCVVKIGRPPDEVGTNPECESAPYFNRVTLTDGGVYDNLGLETAFKRYQTLLVSDGGMHMSLDPEPHKEWVLHTKRVLDLVDNQVRSLRKRQLIAAFRLQPDDPNRRTGTYWGIRTELAKYGVEDPFGYSGTSRPRWQDTKMLAAIPTRMATMESFLQDSLINWGYAICDAALRSRTVPRDLNVLFGLTIKPARGLPYPR